MLTLPLLYALVNPRLLLMIPAAVFVILYCLIDDGASSL